MDPRDELLVQGLQEGRIMCFRGVGGSMIPCLRAGDLVTIVPGKPGRVGDVVLCRRDGNLVLHRVVAKWRGALITKGDALGRRDEPVAPRDLVGRAVSFERRGVSHSLDSLGSRLLGLAFSLTVPRVPKLMGILAAVKRLGRERLGLAGL